MLRRDTVEHIGVDILRIHATQQRYARAIAIRLLLLQPDNKQSNRRHVTQQKFVLVMDRYCDSSIPDNDRYHLKQNRPCQCTDLRGDS